MALGKWTLAEALAVSPLPPEEVVAWGPTLVLAPHPDDEALGCGGAIALLRQHNVPVEIVWLTDGRGSHPHSRVYPPEKLVALRQAEAHAAAAALGMEAAHRHFLMLEDTRVPLPPEADAVAALRRLLSPCQTVLTPWRLDPHGDHRAAYAYVMAAAAGWPGRVLEYPVWLWQNGAPEDFPNHDDFVLQRAEIGSVLTAKRSAIAAHRSQMTDLIADDPQGFRVPAEMRAHFEQPWELYLFPR